MDKDNLYKYMEGAMNTFQLECFLAVAEYLNFTKAAEQMQLTQPAISNQIKNLEAELGVKLFLRTSREVKLTKAGTQLLEEAKNILRSFGNIKRRMEESDGIFFRPDFNSVWSSNYHCIFFDFTMLS